VDVTCEQDEEAGTYAIGATVDGVFVPFYTLPATHVDTLVASGKQAQENAANETPAQ
jgi:hypothetical protein